jgi:DNA-binding response OmpR family regulator
MGPMKYETSDREANDRANGLAAESPESGSSIKTVLVIQHDPTVGAIYRSRFQTEGYQVELAADGETGLAMLAQKGPCLLILDLTLPKISGVEIIRKIRSTSATRSLPIVVLTDAYNSDTVKRAWEAGADRCLTKMISPPAQVLKVSHAHLLERSAHPADPAGESRLTPTAAQASLNGPSRGFWDEAPQWLATLRSLWIAVARVEESAHRMPLLFELYQKVHSLTGNAVAAEACSVARLSSALEALLKELHDKPRHINRTTLGTVAQGLDFLETLVRKIGPADEDYFDQSSILAVDDEIISRKAIAHALEKARLSSFCMGDPLKAFSLLAENNFDLVILDVDMPGMDGIEFCRQMRALPRYADTPVIFVTQLKDLHTHAGATLSGGNDFLTKPFLYIELAVKALIQVMNGRLAHPRLRVTSLTEAAMAGSLEGYACAAA